MNENKENTPRIRFPGFTEAWEQRRLAEITSLITKGTTPKDKSWIGPVNYIKTESIDSLSGNITIKANTSLEEHEGYLKRSQLKEKDILFSIVGTLGRVGIVESKDLPANTNQQIAIIRLKDSNTNFILNALKTNHIQSFIKSDSTIGAQPSLSLWQINDLQISVPISEEQKQIGTFFKQLDHLITLHQRKLNNVKNLKVGLLQKMFPKNGEEFPEVRFPGFTDAWEQRKLGEIADRVVRKNTNLESVLPLTISAQYGLVDQIKYFNKRVASRDVSNYYLMKKGEFAYNKSYSEGYPFGAVKRLDAYEMGVLSTLYIIFTPREEIIYSDYLVSYYDTNIWHKQVEKRAAEGARNHGLLNISAGDFFDTELKFPKEKGEQAKIGDFFSNLDHLITLHQRKLEHLQEQKKALLQQMFI